MEPDQIQGTFLIIELRTLLVACKLANLKENIDSFVGIILLIFLGYAVYYQKEKIAFKLVSVTTLKSNLGINNCRSTWSYKISFSVSAYNFSSGHY